MLLFQVKHWMILNLLKINILIRGTLDDTKFIESKHFNEIEVTLAMSGVAI